MCTAGDSGEIIILSDDEEDDKENDLSCLIVEVEDVKKTGNYSCISHFGVLCKVFML